MASRSFSNSLGPLISAQVVYGSWINDQRQTLSRLPSTGMMSVCEHLSAGRQRFFREMMSRLVIVLGSFSCLAFTALLKE